MPPIDSSWRRIETCEPRLALSASLSADLLLEALEFEPAEPVTLQSFKPDSLPDSETHPPTPATSPDLIDQAALLRDSRAIDGRGQTVAVIDSGIAWDHVALGAGYGPGYRVVGGWDFAEDDADPYDDGPAGYHGTHIAGLLAGQADGYAGVAPAADIVSLRVFDDSGQGRLQWIESALQWVHQHHDSFASPITTVNLSVGAALSEANRNEAMEMLEDEFELLRENDILVFAASGNQFSNSPASSDELLYPASSASVVAVSSINAEGRLSAFAQREDGIFASRGESVSSAVPDHVFGWDGKVDDFAELDGTSVASPQVAGASMLVRQALIEAGHDPTAESILAHLRDSSVEAIDPLTDSRYRTIDLQSAIDSIQPLESEPLLDRFDGTNQSEHLELDLRSGIRLSGDGISYQLDPHSQTSPLVIDVSGGDDSLKIIGSEHAERLVLHPVESDTSRLWTNDYAIELRGFEQVTFDGGGGRDRATLYDSPESDKLVSHPTVASLAGVGFQFEVNNVPRIYVHGTSGGKDIAFLHDGAGDDLLAVRPQFTSLRGDNTFQLAYGFERVYAYANAGGNDTANLYDSSGDDTMSISSTRSIIAGPGYQVTALGFESTIGHAIAGGEDVARIYADTGENQFRRTPDMVQWTNADGAQRIARHFERTLAFEQYQAIELRPQSTARPTPWYLDDPEERSRRETQATRAVFEALGSG